MNKRVNLELRHRPPSEVSKADCCVDWALEVVLAAAAGDGEHMAECLWPLDGLHGVSRSPVAGGRPLQSRLPPGGRSAGAQRFWRLFSLNIDNLDIGANSLY